MNQRKIYEAGNNISGQDSSQENPLLAAPKQDGEMTLRLTRVAEQEN